MSTPNKGGGEGATPGAAAPSGAVGTGAAGVTFELRREIPPVEQPARLAALEKAVRERTVLRPVVGLVLGSGLGGLADALDLEVAIPFGDLPGWPDATAPGHAGKLLFGRLSGVPVVVQQGRFHLYEGHSAGFVVQPVLLMGRLGAKTVVLTNAAGGVNPGYAAGTLMVIADHLNMTGRSPLVGANADEIGPRFPDMTGVWDADLRSRLHAAAGSEGVTLAEGVYACLLGPSYETPAEVRMLDRIGADAVGMSTALEAVAARWAGIKVCGVSLVTNPGAGLSGAELSHAEVLAAAELAGPRLSRVIARFVAELDTAR
jgi:purine-nucleoside phosphorylase